MTTIGHEARSLHKREFVCLSKLSSYIFQRSLSTATHSVSLACPEFYYGGCRIPSEIVGYRMVGDTRIERVFSVPITDTELEALSD
jgi:hypothetical protein